LNSWTTFEYLVLGVVSQMAVESNTNKKNANNNNDAFGGSGYYGPHDQDIQLMSFDAPEYVYYGPAAGDSRIPANLYHEQQRHGRRRPVDER